MGDERKHIDRTKSRDYARFPRPMHQTHIVCFCVHVCDRWVFLWSTWPTCFSIDVCSWPHISCAMRHRPAERTFVVLAGRLQALASIASTSRSFNRRVHNYPMRWPPCVSILNAVFRSLKAQQQPSGQTRFGHTTKYSVILSFALNAIRPGDHRVDHPVRNAIFAVTIKRLGHHRNANPIQTCFVSMRGWCRREQYPFVWRTKAPYFIY